MVRAFGADFGRFWMAWSGLLLLRDISPGKERPGKGPPANQGQKYQDFGCFWVVGS